MGNDILGQSISGNCAYQIFTFWFITVANSNSNNKNYFMVEGHHNTRNCIKGRSGRKIENWFKPSSIIRFYLQLRVGGRRTGKIFFFSKRIQLQRHIRRSSKSTGHLSDLLVKRQTVPQSLSSVPMLHITSQQISFSNGKLSQWQNMKLTVF